MYKQNTVLLNKHITFSCRQPHTVCCFNIFLWVMSTVFRGYVVVSRREVELFVPPNKITAAVDLHLNVNQCGDQECVV